MDNLDTSDVLLNRGLNGYYGAGARGYNGNFTYDGSVVNANLLSNRDFANIGHNSISRQISDNADRNRDIAETQARDSQFAGIISNNTDQTRFITAELNQLGREMAATARDAAKCCCEAKLLAVENQAKTDAGLAAILANQTCDTRVEAAVANANQNAKLDQLLSENGRGRPGQGN